MMVHVAVLWLMMADSKGLYGWTGWIPTVLRWGKVSGGILNIEVEVEVKITPRFIVRSEVIF